MKVRVLYFAVARELAGTREEELTIAAGATVGDARRAIERAHPSLGASDAEALAEGDVLAIVPPVAGG